MSVIYQPDGKAGEFSELACNLYKGCAHGCVYCYGPNATFTKRETFNSTDYIRPRPGILGALRKEAPKYAGDPRSILLCFTSDPYQPIEQEQRLTRQALEILANNNCTFTTLTKGGSWGIERDMDLFLRNPMNTWSATLTHDDPVVSKLWEPGAALPQERINALRIAHDAGIKTWVSFEPVFDPEAVYRLLTLTHEFVDFYKVGKINYHPIQHTINWPEFREKIEAQLKSLNKSYLLKKDLLAA